MPTEFEPEVLLRDMQAAIAEKLMNDSWFTGIDVYTPDDITQDGQTEAAADIVQRIEQSLSSLKKGICIVALFPKISGIAPDSPGIYADTIPLVVRTIENPLVNRGANGTRKTASMVMTRVMRRLQHFTYRDCVITVQSARQIPDESNLIWDVIGKTSANFPALET